MNRSGIDFRKQDNAFLAVDDPAALQAAIYRLSPALIRARLDYWTLLLGPKFSAKEDKMDWKEWHGKALADHINLTNQYRAQGYGFISLSIYGSIASPFYAAVMIRPAPSEQHHYASVPANQMQQIFISEAAQGYGPAIIAATGATYYPMFAAVFEPQNPIALTRWGLRSGSANDAQLNSKEYGPFSGWVPLNYADNHILWRDANNQISLWLVDDQGNQLGYKQYGPFNGWVPMNYSDNHILWHDANNQISLWTVDYEGNKIGFKQYGPFPGWVPLNYADNHILWRDANNQISLWLVDDQGNQLGYKQYGPFDGWVPVNYSDNHILWHDANNQISFWTVDYEGNRLGFKQYGPFNGWVPMNYSDNHILWQDANNRISLWAVDGQGGRVISGGQAVYTEFGPISGWLPLNYSDNHILWHDGSDRISLWEVGPDTIQGVDVWAKLGGLILRSAAAYGDSSNPAFAGVWSPNIGGTLWNNDGVGESASVYQARFDAEFSVWCRPALVTPDASGQYLSLFVDNQIGPWQARHDLTSDDYQTAVDTMKQQGYFPVSVQAAGADQTSATFAAVFATSRDVIAKEFTPTGPVANSQIDNIIQRMMASYGLRHAALGIVHGTQLVYARGYTLAEEGWPLAQPTTFFRLASVSKVPTALAIFQLIDKQMLSLEDRMQDILQLFTPSAGFPSDGRFRDITIQHLLEHTSGLGDIDSLGVLKAYKDANNNTASLPVTAQWVNSALASLQLVSTPGAKQAYSNTGYYMLAQVVGTKWSQEVGDPLLRPIDAYQNYLFTPLSITRIRRGVSLIADQPPDEARYQNHDLQVFKSVMSDSQPLVADGYGSGSLPMEIDEGGGGLSAAATDLARLVAILISQKDSPGGALTRKTLTGMLSKGAHLTAAGFGRAGYGFDVLNDLGGGQQFYGQKGGLIDTAGTVLQFNQPQGWGFTLLQAGNGGALYPGSLTYPDLYPDFPEVMNIAQNTDWGSADLFPEFGMPSL